MDGPLPVPGLNPEAPAPRVTPLTVGHYAAWRQEDLPPFEKLRHHRKKKLYAKKRESRADGRQS